MSLVSPRPRVVSGALGGFGPSASRYDVSRLSISQHPYSSDSRDDLGSATQDGDGEETEGENDSDIE